MDERKTKTLLELVDEAVSGRGDDAGKTWQQKRDALLAEASDSQKTALEEFASWFEDDEE